jgi:hypothetical protein
VQRCVRLTVVWMTRTTEKQWKSLLLRRPGYTTNSIQICVNESGISRFFCVVLVKLCPFDEVARQYFVDVVLNVGFNQIYF